MKTHNIENKDALDLDDSSSENIAAKNETINFDVPKYYSIVIGANKWEPVYSGYTYNKKNEKMLSNSWTHWLANILSKKIPSC